MCQCKHTANSPYCDGTHQKFSQDQIGQEGPGVQIQAAAMPVATATKEEPTVEFIHQLARDGLSKMGHHGPMTSMGVPRYKLPHWDELQIMAAQMARKPLMEDVAVATELVIGPKARKPLKLSIPLFVSDMSYGSLSEEAKIALAKGAELAGTDAMFGIHFGSQVPQNYRDWKQTDSELYTEFAMNLIESGIMLEPDSREPWFICEAHKDIDLAKLDLIADAAMAKAIAKRS